MTGWIALGPEGDMTRVCAVQGGQVILDNLTDSEAAALTQARGALTGLPDPLVIRVGEGQPHSLPAPLLPEGGGRDISGFVQKSPEDVIGAWPRLWMAGILADDPHWDGIICLCMDHVTQWIYVSAQEVIGSLSTLTPQLVTALDGAVTCADKTALSDALSRPERLAIDLRQAQQRADAASLTGHLIGTELAATRAYWLGREAIVISGTPLGQVYLKALQDQGVQARLTSPTELRPAAMQALAKAMKLT